MPEARLVRFFCFWLLVLDEIVMCSPYVICKKFLVQQMAQANKELNAGEERTDESSEQHGADVVEVWLKK
ncbi:hypothetical protein [Pseudomonas syringae group genomosp. 3]|uniref:Uncharacterized protein n=1 Tax=Pseudomonas syringae pv. primulae TaxID=251707 RepID=A0A3M4SJJ2_9PSED|nr:hypothetical protein [Pseudomonas syringae group genomosp. 3]RMR15024.1 hypothetical protein ALP92_03277 [Pseudomonas syringae pv. primulae]